MANARLEKVVLDAVSHEVVANGLLGDLFEIGNCLVVITLGRGDIGYLKPELIGEACLKVSK